MNPISIPSAAKAGRPECRLVSMGPPRGVADEDCGTVEMLISPDIDRIPGYAGRAQYAYFRPSDAELEELRRGGFIEFAQYGTVVQPFSATVWPAGNRTCRVCGCTDDDCSSCIERQGHPCAWAEPDLCTACVA